MRPPDSRHGSRWRQWLFRGIVGTLALILLLLQIESRGIWQDEGLTLYQVRLPLDEILANRIPVARAMTPNTVPPLFFLLLGMWGRIVGFELWALRLFSVLCTLIFIFLLYRVGKRVGNERLGRIAALLGAVSPVLWWYAQELRMYAFLLVPATLSFGLLWRWYQSDTNRFPWATVIVYGLTVAVMIYTHYISFYIVGAQLLWLALVLYPRHPRMVVTVGVAAVLVAFPLIPFAINRLTLGAERDFFFMPLHAIAADVVQSFALGTPRFVSRWEEIWWLLPVAWAILGLGLWQAKRVGGWQLAMLLGIGFVLPIAAIAALGYIKPIYQNVRHAFVVAPVFYLLWAFGLVRLYEMRRWISVMVILLFGYGWSLSTVHYFAPDIPLKNDVRPMFEALAQRYAPKDVIVMNDPILQHALQYFAPDVAWEVLPPYGETDQDQREASYRSVAGGYERVWVVWGPPDSTHDTWRELKDYYEEHYGRLDYLEYPGQTRIEAGLFDTKGELFTMNPLPVPLPAPANFGDGLQLLGLARPLVESPPCQAGQRLVIQTLWQAETMPTQNYQYVARLVDGAGQVWGQSQGYPYQGLHLTNHWQPGQYLRLPIFIDIPTTLPPATYYVSFHWVAPDGSLRYADGASQPKVLISNIPVVRPTEADTAGGEWLTDGMRVQAIDLPPTLAAPVTSLPLTVRVHVADSTTLPTAFRVMLRGQDGQTVWTQDLDPAQGGPRRADGTPEFPPSAWQVGDTFDLRYALAIPPTLEGTFTLYVTAIAGDTPLPVPQWGGWITSESLNLGKVVITPRPRTYEVPAVAVPVNQEWFNAVRLVGYSPASESFRSDEPFEVELVWQAVAPTGRPYKVFLHLLDGEGNFVTGADGFLQVPSNAWDTDEVTISRHRFEAGSTPSGQYTWVVGLYHEETGERLPVDAPNFAVSLGEVTVR
jgi:4-amino-4-deoxy-L-arabinose transferase-like glycosyltransferase